MTEKSFESSAMYFESQFLNPYGLHRFGEAAVGLVDDPFLALQLNPAHLPTLQTDRHMFYLDFRGDREEEEIIEHYYHVPYYDYVYAPWPQWYSTTREEPLPILSLGYLGYPFGSKADNFFLGGSYQVVHQQEKFYEPPALIYRYEFGYDAFGERDANAPDVPIQDRYVGKDELLTQAHIVSLFGGLRFGGGSSLGLAFNSTTHSRDGGYIRSQADEYGDTYDRDYGYYRERERNQQYQHYDFMAGLRHRFASGFSAGATVGYLTGDADQDYLVVDSSYYRYNTEGQYDNWSRSVGSSRTSQVWNRDGHTHYGGVQISKELTNGRTVRAYYRYSRNVVDIDNRSTIRDTSNYRSLYTYNLESHRYTGVSQTIDDRTATGERKRIEHEGMATLQWDLNSKNRIYVGLYFSRQKTKTYSREPVTAERWSQHERWVDDSLAYSYYRRVYEEKRLVWEMESSYWTVQVPIMLRWQLDERFGLTLGVNRILENHHTRDRTTAYFRIRDVYGSEPEVDFGERYIQPDDKRTEDYTEVIASLDVDVAPEFAVRLMVNPDLEDTLRIAQWWLSFELRP